MLPLCFHRFPVSLVLRAALFGEIRYIDLLMICQFPNGQSTKIENPYNVMWGPQTLCFLAYKPH